MPTRDPLATYRAKRDFTRTPEPPPDAVQAGVTLRYYIQRHAARRLHYDFRLEWDGTLKSWAVPKGPSLDPLEKRLAVRVEDHPLDYGSFEGTIPAGEYGAGDVLLWDRGEWIPKGDPAQGLARGKLHFELHGEKLRGEFVLFRLRDEDGSDKNWLLRKLEDRHARPGDGEGILITRPESVALPPAVAARTPTPKTRARKRARLAAPPALILPQLATAAAKAPTDSGWMYEVKYDGYRMLSRIDSGQVKIVSRNGQDWTPRLRPLAAALAQLPVKNAWLDGEITVMTARGTSSFQALQRALDGAPAQVAYFLFDLLWRDGEDLRPWPQDARYAALQSLLARVPATSPLHLSQTLEADGEAAWQAACRLGLEGLIGKRRDAPYSSGRVRHWIKLKCRPEQEFVIGGFTEPGGSRKGLGALLVGVQAPQGGLDYAGRVGTGFDETTLQKLRQRLGKLTIAASPFVKPPRLGSATTVHWVRPQLVAQVQFAEWSADGQLRQASFIGLREDKDARAVRRGTVAETPASTTSSTASGTGDRFRGVRITHPDRVVYAQPALTKRDVLRYYDAVADVMLPHLRDRPLSMLRCPDGTTGTCFFQKHLRTRLPAGLAPVTVQEKDGPSIYVAVTAPEGIVALAQHAIVEFHPWGSRQPRIDLADRLIIDLDPDDGVPWSTLIEAALLTRTLLTELKLAAYVKTTGGKGLHVVAPLKPTRPWSEIKAFARALALQLTRVAPARFTANLAKASRSGKIFIDYLRNGEGATAICAYSLRARPGAPVAMPIDWDDLSPARDLRFDVYNLQSAPAQLRQAQAAWASFERDARAVSAAAMKAVDAARLINGK